ncbi:MAG: hypothetical protein WBC53_08245 [Phycisphaerae bacterium]
MTAPTNCTVWFGVTPSVPVLAAPQIEVLVDGSPERRVRLDAIETEEGRVPRAKFSVGLGCGPDVPDNVRLEDAVPDIRPGRRVQARLLRGGTLPGAVRGDLFLFDGRILEVEFSLDPDGERLEFEAEDLAASVLRRRVGGQRTEGASGEAEHADGLDLVFNPDGRLNAAAAPYDPGDGDPYAIFAPVSPAGAIAWTLNEAVAYLVAEYARSDLWHAPSCTSVREALDALVLQDVSLQGRTLGEALDALLELVGGRLVVTVEPGEVGVSRSVDLWLPDRARSISLAHQPVGAAFHASATHFSDMGVTMQFDSAPRRYVARGGPKVFESTFDLVPGWDDSLASYDPNEFSPSANPNFDAVRDVFRKWVLNEAGEYSLAPYDRGPPPDFSDLFGGEPYVRRHRRLLACLSRDALGRSRGVYVEVSLDGGATWQRMNAALQVPENECGVYLTEDPLPPEYIRAAMRGYVQVRVTAALESDACLAAERACEEGDDLPGRTRYFHVPAGYRYRWVAATSKFYGSPADEVDDSSRLQAFVDAAFETDRRSPAPARIRIPYLAFGFRAGDRIVGVRGRRLELAREHVTYQTNPVIRRITFRLFPEPGTELELS